MTETLKEILGEALLNKEEVEIPKKKNNRKYISRTQLKEEVEQLRYEMSCLHREIYELKRENYKVTVAFNSAYISEDNEDYE